MIDGCPTANQLTLLADGSSGDAEREAVERHLDVCLACTQVITELAWLVGSPRTTPVRYRVVRVAGDAWIADDLERGHQVVLRFIAAGADRREALVAAGRTVGALRNPHVVAIDQAGRHEDEVYYASPVVPGATVRTWLDTRPSPGEIVTVWRAAIDGVAALHTAGLVHGAVSPDHVIVDDQGGVRVDGFGAASTSAYSAVELLHGASPSAKSDQFALCASLWECLAGRRPFAGGTVGALAVAMTVPLEPPKGVDRWMFEVLARGLDPVAARRWPDLAALIAALDRPVRGLRRRWIAIAGMAAVAAAAIAAIVIGA